MLWPLAFCNTFLASVVKLCNGVTHATLAKKALQYVIFKKMFMQRSLSKRCMNLALCNASSVSFAHYTRMQYSLRKRCTPCKSPKTVPSSSFFISSELLLKQDAILSQPQTSINHLKPLQTSSSSINLLLKKPPNP